MSPPAWWRTNPEALADIKAALSGPYATLRLDEEPEALFVRGVFPVLDGEDVLDTYQVEISFPDTYPEDPPAVRETASRISHTPERHNSSGTACLFVPLEWKLRRPDLSFHTFIDEPMRAYFLGQSLVEAGQPWPYGERSHGFDGILEALQDLLSLSSKKQAVDALWYLNKDEIKGHWPCSCGSGQRLRACHGPRLRKLHTAQTKLWARGVLAAHLAELHGVEKLNALLKKKRRRPRSISCAPEPAVLVAAGATVGAGGRQ